VSGHEIKEVRARRRAWLGPQKLPRNLFDSAGRPGPSTTHDEKKGQVKARGKKDVFFF